MAELDNVLGTAGTRVMPSTVSLWPATQTLIPLLFGLPHPQPACPLAIWPGRLWRLLSLPGHSLEPEVEWEMAVGSGWQWAAGPELAPRGPRGSTPCSVPLGCGLGLCLVSSPVGLGSAAWAWQRWGSRVLLSKGRALWFWGSGGALPGWCWLLGPPAPSPQGTGPVWTPFRLADQGGGWGLLRAGSRGVTVARIGTPLDADHVFKVPLSQSFTILVGLS